MKHRLWLSWEWPAKWPECRESESSAMWFHPSLLEPFMVSWKCCIKVGSSRASSVTMLGLYFTFCWPCIMQWFLVNDQRDAQILFCVFISIYNSLHVMSTLWSSSEETNCINTASDNSNSMLVAEVCADWKKTCTHLGHQRRITVTRGCIDTICLSW
jgi:hypothetical protein